MLYLIVLLVAQPYLRKGDQRLHLLVQVEIILMLYAGFIFANGDSSIVVAPYLAPFNLNCYSSLSFDYVLTIILIAVFSFLALTFLVQLGKYVLLKLRSYLEEQFRLRRERGEVSEAELEKLRL